MSNSKKLIYFFECFFEAFLFTFWRSNPLCLTACIVNPILDFGNNAWQQCNAKLLQREPDCTNSPIFSWSSERPQSATEGSRVGRIILSSDFRCRRPWLSYDSSSGRSCWVGMGGCKLRWVLVGAKRDSGGGGWRLWIQTFNEWTLAEKAAHGVLTKVDWMRWSS